MPEKPRQVVMCECSRCGWTWLPRRGKPFRCAACKSPYWDRPVRGKKTPWTDRLLVPQATTGGGVEVSDEKAADILSTWRFNRSWVSVTVEDNLASVSCGGFLQKVGLNRVELSDAQQSVVRLSMALRPRATYEHCVGRGEVDGEPYETLEIHFDQCLVYLGAFRTQPETFWSML